MADSRTVEIGVGVNASVWGGLIRFGTGDLSAAALSSLDRDLQTSRTLPPHARTTFVSLTLLPGALLSGNAPSTRVDACGRVLVLPPASWAPGPRDARHPLLL